jgi:hypothetical protein
MLVAWPGADFPPLLLASLGLALLGDLLRCLDEEEEERFDPFRREEAGDVTPNSFLSRTPEGVGVASTGGSVCVEGGLLRETKQ